jgi:hypothetical protein
VTQLDPLPEHAIKDLARMTAENWQEIRDSMLARKVEVVVVVPAEPKKIGVKPKK